VFRAGRILARNFIVRWRAGNDTTGPGAIFSLKNRDPAHWRDLGAHDDDLA
jgi:hypothetical protein